MFGIELPVNFRNPFKTLTIVAYWRNWHITLTRFMGKYVYIPLGGNRKGRARMCANMMLVYILSGLWHGANATYILWGALNGLIYVPVKLAEDARKRKAKQAGRIYIRDDFGQRFPPVKRFAARLGNYIVNSMMFIPFMASSLAEAGVYIKSMWSSLVTAISSGNALSAFAIREDYLKVFETDELWYVLKGLHIAAHSFAPALCMVVIFGITFAAAMLSKSAQDIAAKMKINVKNAVLLGALLSWCILTYSQVTTFIYVNF
jgi:D-alanyl-lipoteichoic acid acyltransferase DltB (MBOAT superfamily)